jgi:DNA-binding transcriptional ArsR family regulator
LTDQLGLVFAALADPTRRQMVDTLLRDGSTSVPALSDKLPITRQAIAKHIAALDHAGLIERWVDGADGAGSSREVHYRLRADALRPAAAWMREADEAWAHRLDRLKETVQRRR